MFTELNSFATMETTEKVTWINWCELLNFIGTMPFWTSLVPETPLEEATQSFRLSSRFLLDIDL